MNNDEFLKRLSEVSEWYRPQTGPNGQPSVSKGRAVKVPEHPGPITAEELDEMTEEAVTEYYERLMAWREAQPNITVPPEILKVKYPPQSCEDCDKILEEPRRVERKLHESSQRHWRERCVNCDCFKHPQTGEYSISKKYSHQFFIDFYRPKKGVYKSKYQKEPKVKKEPKPRGRPKKMTKSQLVEQIIAEGTWVTHETETSVIREFVPKNPGLE
jgi:hypothetical protein